jgi:hypothetical protein
MQGPEEGENALEEVKSSHEPCSACWELRFASVQGMKLLCCTPDIDSYAYPMIEF